MKLDAKKSKKIILLKITGEVINNPTYINQIAKQINDLKDKYYFNIVIGGGNLWRDSNQNQHLKLNKTVSHQIGMIATCINGLIIQEVFKRNAIPSTILSAFFYPSIGQLISPQTIEDAIEKNLSIIFVGGTSNPFFTTDTTAVIRALEIKANELWKGTKVDGIYTKDPLKYKDAKLIKNTTYSYAIEHKINIMDKTAFILAEEYKVTIRIFNIFDKKGLINAAYDSEYGSTIK